jgi:hypothetical protein
MDRWGQPGNSGSGDIRPRMARPRLIRSAVTLRGQPRGDRGGHLLDAPCPGSSLGRAAPDVGRDLSWMRRAAGRIKDLRRADELEQLAGVGG